MSNLNRILEVMNYQVGRPITEQKKYLIIESSTVDDILRAALSVVGYTRGAGKLFLTNAITDNISGRFKSLSLKYGLPPNPTLDDLYRALSNLDNEINTKGIRSTSNPGGVSDDLINQTQGDLQFILGRWASELTTNITNPVERLRIIGEIDSDVKKLLRQYDDVMSNKNIRDASYDDKNLILNELEKVKAYFESRVSTTPFLGSYSKDVDDLIQLIKTKMNFRVSDVSVMNNRIWNIFGEEISVQLPELIRKLKDQFFKQFGERADNSDYSKKLVDLLQERIDRIQGSLGSQGQASERDYRRVVELVYNMRKDINQTFDAILLDMKVQGLLTDEQIKTLTTDNKFVKEFADRINSNDITLITALGEEFTAMFKMVYGTTIIPPVLKGLALKAVKQGNYDFWKTLGVEVLDGYKRSFWSTFYLSSRLPSEINRLRTSLNSSLVTISTAWFMEKVYAYLIAPYVVASLEFMYNSTISVIQDIEAVEKNEAINQFINNCYLGTNGWGKRAFGDSWSPSSAFRILADQRGGADWGNLLEDFEGDNEFERVGEWFTEFSAAWTKMGDVINRWVESGVQGEDTIFGFGRGLEEFKKELDRLSGKTDEDEPEPTPVTPPPPPVDNSNNNTDDLGGDNNGQEEITGLEQLMRSKFEIWALQNPGRNPSWLSYSNNVGVVSIDGMPHQIARTDTDVFIIILEGGMSPIIIN